jgi:hypothetical protein
MDITTTTSNAPREHSHADTERCLVCGFIGPVILCAKHAKQVQQALKYHRIDMSEPLPPVKVEDDILDPVASTQNRG